jgi:ABC-type cobalamin/Fe3+-siderophores transport system ATPase subunit
MYHRLNLCVATMLIWPLENRRMRMQGRFTLVLGPPSSGKATFLRALAGRVPEEDLAGRIVYSTSDGAHFDAAQGISFAARRIDGSICVKAGISVAYNTPTRKVCGVPYCFCGCAIC